MKRISILALIAWALIPDFAMAWCSGGAYDSGVHYSMYAFNFHNSGLICGCVYYSPYAFSYDNVGLVGCGTRYSPYAFNFEHNGLVTCWGYGYGWYNNACPDRRSGETGALTRAVETLSSTIKDVSQEYRATRSGVPYRSSGVAVTVNKAQPLDQRRIVQKTLNRIMPGRFKVTRPFRIDRENVSFDVVIMDENLIIKYWNPEKVASIKETAGAKAKLLSNYITDWARMANEHTLSGGKVVQIVESDCGRFINKLVECLENEMM